MWLDCLPHRMGLRKAVSVRRCGTSVGDDDGEYVAGNDFPCGWGGYARCAACVRTGALLHAETNLERKEIFRGIATHQSARSTVRQLGRQVWIPSTSG
jgi:hypothetical protein